MPPSPAEFFAEVARLWSPASGVAALILGGGGLVALVSQPADSETRSVLMDTVLAIERLEAELVAEISRVPEDLFAEFIAESERTSRAERLDDSLAAALRKLANLPERFRAELAMLVGDHVAATQQRVRRLRSDLVEIQDLRKRMFGTMNDLVRTTDFEHDLYAAVVEVVAAVHGQVQEEVLPTGEDVAVGVARVLSAAANSTQGTLALASEFATHAAALAERRAAVQGNLEEILASAQERRRDIHRLVDELRAEWDASEPPAWVALALALTLVAVGMWTALATVRYRDAERAPAGRSLDPTETIVSRISAARISAAAHEIMRHASSLRQIPQYSGGSGTSGANTVRSIRVLDAAIEQTARSLGRFLDAAASTRSGEAVASTRSGKAVALAQCVTSAVSAARRAAGRDVAFEVSADNARVLSSSDDVRLILGNVLANAVEAADAKTRTSRVRVLIEVDSDHAEATVVVTDNGPGMTKGVQDHAFDLFFTTKANRPGAGLAVARQLATRWGGSMSISQSGGSGATVRILLPLATDEDRKAKIRRSLTNGVLRLWRDRLPTHGTA